MAKQKGQSSFLGIAAVLLPLLLAAVAGIIWFSATSGTDRGDTARLAAAVQAGQALAGDNVALDRLAETSSSGALSGDAASAARNIVSSAAAIRAVNTGAGRIETAVNSIRERVAGSEASAVGLDQLVDTLAAVDTGLAALRGAPADAAATVTALTATTSGLSELSPASAAASSDNPDMVAVSAATVSAASAGAPRSAARPVSTAARVSTS